MKKIFRKFQLAPLLLVVGLAWHGCTKTIDVPVAPETAGVATDGIDPDFEAHLADGPLMAPPLDSLVLSNGATIRQFLADNPEYKTEYDNVLRNGRVSGTLDETDLAKRWLWTEVLLNAHAHQLTNITQYSALWDAEAQTMKDDPYKNKDFEVIEGRRVFTPKQPRGLGYSWGQKNWRVREIPPGTGANGVRDGVCLDHAVYGLDCSGFIYSVFRMAGFGGITQTNVAGMYSLDYWKKVMKSSPRQLDDVQVNFVRNAAGQTEFPVSQAKALVRPGDLIFWKSTRWNHIGMVLRTLKGDFGVYQANGLGNSLPAGCYVTPPIRTCPNYTKCDCETNFACPGRGVRIQSLDWIAAYNSRATVSIIRLQALVGNPGNPRFNLRFTNESNVDLDLHVRTPGGYHIYYGDELDRSSQGQLDVDCYCESCPQGPNENIFWPLERPSPTGKYQFWIEYFEACRGGSPASNYEVLVVNDKIPKVIFRKTGTMARNSPIPRWEYDSVTGTVRELP